MFIENGYREKELQRIIDSYFKSPNNNERTVQDFNDAVSLPWVPNLTNKLKQAFKKHGIKTVTKSASNLQNLLCNRNKPKLPKNSYPGVYIVDCKCGARYTGGTGCSVCNRIKQHAKSVFEGNWKDSGLAEHAKNCNNINWEGIKTISVEPSFFKRAVRESLEIQCLKTEPGNIYGMNRDTGRYVKTNTWRPVYEHWRKSKPRLARWRNQCTAQNQ